MAIKNVDPGTTDYSMAELVAVEMSRNLAENDSGPIGAVGAGATMPMAACRLAQLTVAPNLCWICGGPVNPTFDHLSMTAFDPESMAGAESKLRMLDVIDMGLTGNWGFGFSGGLQMDKFGNTNMIGIGAYDHLKVRGPGQVGLIWAGTMKMTYLFFWHHNRRIFVDKVDFINGPGFQEGGDSRWKYSPADSMGPRIVYTPICTMDFEETSRKARLRSVHPGYTVDDVVANTGFELILPRNVQTTKPPTEEELQILRTSVDRGGVLKSYPLTVG